MRARIVSDAGLSINYCEPHTDAPRLTDEANTMLASLLHLIDMIDDDRLLDWKTMATFGVPSELLEPHEQEFVKWAQRSNASFYRSGGVSPRVLLCRVISFLGIDCEVESRLNGRHSFNDRKEVVLDILDSAG